jgi:uncharacterized protein (TIGR00369 family)
MDTPAAISAAPTHPALPDIQITQREEIKMHYGFSDYIGIEDIGFVSSDRDRQFTEPRYKVGLRVRKDHLNANDTLHGGVVATLLDACMARVFFLGLPPEEMATLKAGVTVEMKTNFLRTQGLGEVYALGTIIKRGRSISFTEGELLNNKGELLAKASATMMILRK